MKRLFNPLIILMVVVLGIISYIPCVEGSFISMETTASATFQENTLVAKVSVTNKGDEPAYNVQIGIDAFNNVASIPVKDVIQINETYTIEKTLAMDIQTVGRYPLIVTVDYTDLNQYPFSAISSSHFIYKEDVSPKIHGKIDNVGILDSGIIILSLKNLHDSKKKIRIKLIVPKVLSVTESIKDIELDSESEAEIRFGIKNFSGLLGSSYHVFAVMGYNENKKNCTVTIPGVVKMIGRTDFIRNYLRNYKWVFIGIGIALLAVFLWLQFGGKKTSFEKSNIV
ncbi:MAG: hypothetical protein SCARUB_00336 [Candidatus Scalindua rubra]|uniref:CARDB domain-containing protein n=1 Tax=Candidatus Scalindua rubra TaxID=1872076 RepID=A0A1E3XFQ6_9BACT|nr:MAG: hypothetical protein SCARUB_00336 [Candidatus Scalindua rubra]